ncbi:PIN domain-like protein [Heliocybe sulcata]|uniref:PIN domain-like protein n=1 Tax=Heliocybe sulcata TaxID=5364 RepID=A0A5C3MVD4_9AGAM|nr:PIN domain-like protein [Heliocybe sulcata]
MGVLGLTPFLQKIRPELIRTLPNRLKDLSGSTIVIDGTLITTRLHFAPGIGSHQHVIGWYRLIRELHEANVNAICVFDGKVRSSAKRLETERRRQVRVTDIARGGLELERFERLKKLKRVLDAADGLERSWTTSKLRELVADVPTSSLPPTSSDSELQSHYDDSGVGAISDEHVAVQVLKEQLPALTPSSDKPDSNLDASSPPPTPSDSELQSHYDDSGVGAVSDEHVVGQLLKEQLPALTPSSDKPDSNLDASSPPPTPSESELQSHYDDSGVGAVSDEHVVGQLLKEQLPALTPSSDKPDSNLDASSPPPTPSESELQSHYDDSGIGAASDEHVVGQLLKEQLPALPSSPDKLDSNSDVTELDSAPAAQASGDLVQEITSSAAPSAPSPPAKDQHLEGPEAQALEELVSTEEPESLICPADIPDALGSLYLDYCRSVPALHSMVSAPTPAPADAIEAEEDQVMSRNQQQLLIDEGNVWTSLSNEQGDAVEEEQSLFSLTERSMLISESYQKRTNPPTPKTYKESKLILRAMGVPCIDTEGPFEAEALACALVVAGHADYVASEDTDVLVYEAPLIRNITSKQSPLSLLSGADIRSSLSLSRPAFVDFLLLLGTDFSRRIKNIGPKRALQFIRAHGSIERLIEQETRYPLSMEPEVYLEQVQVARMAYATMPPLPEEEELKQGKWDEEKVRKVLGKFKLLREAGSSLDGREDHQEALAGNYFGDSPGVL